MFKEAQEALIKTSTISGKVLLNNAFYLVPIAVLLYLLSASFDKDITFASKEIAGAKIIASTIILQEQITLGKVDSAEISNEKSKLKKLLDDDMELLQFNDLKAKEKGKLLLSKSEMNNFFENKPNLNFENTLGELQSFIGDMSNLILDPDLDTYYLMDATVYAVPDTLRKLEEIRMILGKEGKISPENIDKLKIDLDFIKNINIARIITGLDTANKEDKNFNDEDGNLKKFSEDKIKNLNSNFESLKLDLEKIIKVDSIKKDDYLVTDSLIKTVASVGSEGALILKSMLETRKSNIKFKMFEFVAIGLIAVMAALIASYIIVKRIKLNLGNIISTLTSSTDEVSNGSQNGTNISHVLSSSVVEQASAIQQISSTTEEISQMAKRSNDFIRSTKGMSEENFGLVKKSSTLVGSLLENVNQLKFGNDQIIDRSNKNSENFESIISIMKTIEDKTKVINDIVFQTKLLSFNASVEAARAGEQGKGFAVVAEEVGNLAELSGKASLEINDLLEKSLQQVKRLTEEADVEIKRVVNSSTQNIYQVSENVNEFKNLNEQIQKNTLEINKMITEVSVASEEQTKAVVEINKAISNMDIVTESNSKLSSELSGLSTILSGKVSELSSAMTSLQKLTGH